MYFWKASSPYGINIYIYIYVCNKFWFWSVNRTCVNLKNVFQVARTSFLLNIYRKHAWITKQERERRESWLFILHVALYACLKFILSFAKKLRYTKHAHARCSVLHRRASVVLGYKLSVTKKLFVTEVLVIKFIYYINYF